jgi:RHS repeat-associated protein
VVVRYVNPQPLEGTPAAGSAANASTCAGAYRFTFQGQEHDDELNGSTGTSYAFEYRIHDPRIGRFMSIDPLAFKFPWNSPYAFAENKVIQYVELEGLETGAKPGSGQPEPYGGDNMVTRALDDVVAYGIEKFNEFSDWWAEADFTMQGGANLTLGPAIKGDGKAFGLTLGGGVGNSYTLLGGQFTAQDGDPRPGVPQEGLTRLNWDSYYYGKGNQQRVNQFSAAKVVVGGESSHTYNQDMTTGAVTNAQQTSSIDYTVLKVSRAENIASFTTSPGNMPLVSPGSAPATTFVGLDLSLDVRLIIGLDASIKIGYTSDHVPENVWK